MGNGQLTKSLITSVAQTPSPKSQHQRFNIPAALGQGVGNQTAVQGKQKYVLLGSQQTANGSVNFRLGISLPLVGEVDLLQPSAQSRIALANGQVPVAKSSEHVHAYILSKGRDGNTFHTHLVIEDKANGLVAADIAAVFGNQSRVTLQGFVSDISDFPLTTLDSEKPFLLQLKTQDLSPTEIDLGTIELLEIEIGSFARSGANHVARRTETGLQIFARGASDDLDNPFNEYPIATVPQSPMATQFSRSQTAQRLSSEIAAGNIFAGQSF